MYEVAPADRQGADDRSRRVIVAILLALAALSWLTTIVVARSPAAMSAMPGQSSPAAAALFAGMWLVMMAAMMLPAITPVVLLFRNVQRSRGARGSPVVPTAIFVGGYLVVWLLAGLAAYLVYAAAQAVATRLHAAAWLVPYAGGAILVLAGLYQLTPLKNTCLRHCRAPLHAVMHGWRDGRAGALLMGATHGLFCLGCCWGIMAVLFVAGLMNLGWMAALSLLIVAEKLSPRGVAIGRAAGGLFVALGVLMAVQPGLFPASGLAMSSGGAQMAGMVGSAAPMSTRTSYRAVAGSYALTLTLGPAEAMLTPTQARHAHARSGEVMLDSMMPGALPTGRVQHLELRVVDQVMGMAVTNARVTMSVQGVGAPYGSLTLARLYGVKEGMKDLHYGANVSLGRGAYTVRVRVDGRLAVFHVRVS